jgi:lambda repressor-like predicted transcriptional regulator
MRKEKKSKEKKIKIKNILKEKKLKGKKLIASVLGVAMLCVIYSVLLTQLKYFYMKKLLLTYCKADS